MITTSEKTENIFKVLFNIYSKMEKVEKNAVNPFYKSKYTTLDHLEETIKPLLIENNSFLVQSSRGTEVYTRLCHVPSCEWIENTVTLPIEKENAQSGGITITYGRRYGLSALLNIVSDEDNDGNKTEPQNYKDQKKYSIDYGVIIEELKPMLNKEQVQEHRSNLYAKNPNIKEEIKIKVEKIYNYKFDQLAKFSEQHSVKDLFDDGEAS